MLDKLKMFYDIIEASDDGLGFPIKNIVSKIKKVIFVTILLSVSFGVGLGYLIFVIIN
jgi:hypothetical protein